MNRKTKPLPAVIDYPALDAWLQKVRARCVWDAPGVDNGKRQGRVLMYVAGPAVFMVTLHPKRRGWELFTSPPTNYAEATFLDAEKRIQYEAPTEGHGHDVPGVDFVTEMGKNGE